jgi:hypothetical protein
MAGRLAFIDRIRSSPLSRAKLTPQTAAVAAVFDPTRTFHTATVIFRYGRRPLRSVLHAETLLDPTLALNGVTDPMSPKTPLKSDDPAQSERFIKDAREAEADKSDSAAKSGFDKFIRGPRPKGPSPKQKSFR